MDLPVKRPSRKTIRLPDFDYASNATYFITVCAFERRMHFGRVNDGSNSLNTFGRIVEEEILGSGVIREELDLHHSVVMPNHMHALLTITPSEIPGPNNVARRLSRPGKSLGSFVAGFKSASTSRIRNAAGNPNLQVWQRNYYEHVIRNEQSFARIWEYIENNPFLWDKDSENPDRYEN